MFKGKQSQWLILPAAILLLLIIVLAGCAQAGAAPSQTSNPTTATAPAYSTIAPPSTTTQNPASTPTTQAPPASSITPAQINNLTGAGSTFAQPLYTAWFDAYAKLTGLKVNYQGIGSGGGISGITDGTLDFGASDAIMTADQQSKAEAFGGPILHLPMTSGATAIIYNLAGIPSGTLKLTGPVLADIYLKKITKWNDPAITALNPGLKLPDEAIAVVHRAEGSGTTFIFTNYLSKVSDEWKTKVGNAISVNWPGDIGGQGSAGVAGQVQQIPGAIGYDELAYAIQNKLPWTLIKNEAGNYEAPSLEGATKASEGITLPDDMRIMITDSTNPDAYPICGFTWILAYVNQKDQAKGTALAKLLWWGIHDGQQYTTPLDYAPLSSDAVTKVENQILSMNYQGKPLLVR